MDLNAYQTEMDWISAGPEIPILTHPSLEIG